MYVKVALSKILLKLNDLNSKPITEKTNEATIASRYITVSY